MALPATDNFTRADGALGANWTGSVGSDLAISSNEVTGASGADSSMYWNADTPGNDQYAKCTIKNMSAGQYVGPFVRGNATDFVILVAQSNTDFQIQWYNGAAWTQIGSTYSATPTAGDVLEIRATGTTFKGFINGVERISGTNVSAPASGSGGLYVYNNSARIDDFEVGNVATATLEQEGFRFGVDDNTESTHGWEAAQDTNISTADATTKLIRLLANATGDPAAIAYNLKYQKNGSGGYATVPLVASVKTKPVIEAADCTVSGSNTAAASWAVSHPAASTGDLLIFYIAWDDSTTTTGVTAPSGANGETLTAINATPITDSSTETRAKAWYCVATGSWTATTKTFTPSATESWSATVVKVPAGEFDAATPIGTTATRASTAVTDTNVLSAAMTAGASDGGGALLWFAGVDTDPLGGTNPTGWTILQSQDLGAVAHGVAVRNTEVTDSESIAGGDTWAIAGDSWTSIGVIVRAPTTTYDLYISASANITAGGEDTTARLTAPSGKTTSDFVTGRRWDNENGTDTIDITTDNYTEVEWCLTLKSGLTGGDYFDFRVYNADAALDTYTVTPRWTISSAVNLTVNDGASVTQSDAVVLTQVHNITVNDGASVTQADAVVITKQSDLIVADAFSVTQADAVTVTKSTSLTVADGASITQADAVILTQVHALTVSDGTSTTQADAVTLTQAHNLTVADGGSITQSDEVLLNVSVTLTVVDAFSTTQADAVTVTQTHVIAVNDGTSETQADSVTLTQVHNLTVNDGAVITQADAVTLSAAGSVAPSDVFSVTQADSVTLTQVHVLTVDNAFSVTQADNVVLGLAGELIVADGHVTTQADAVTVTKQSDLIVNNAYVSSQSDSIIITQTHTLTVASGYSSTQADAPALTQTHVLILAMCYGVTQADAVTIEIISPVAGVGELEIIKADKLRTTYAQAIETIEAQRNRTTKAQNIETIKAPKEYNIKR